MSNPIYQRQLLILGNGALWPREHGSADLTFAFNGQGSTRGLGAHIDVRMTRNDLGVHRVSFISCGTEPASDELQTHVNLLLGPQTHALGCLPSTGYALLHGLWEGTDQVVVQGICFNANLERPKHLSNRKPLPQAFHNWLGERRTSFQRWLIRPPKFWSWPMMAGVDIAQIAGPLACNVRGLHHSEVTEALRLSGRSGTLAPLVRLAAAPVQPSRDLLTASAEMLTLEGMFHLQRDQSETLNWWLYDDEASALLERLASQLRLAQYLAFLQLLTPKVAPD